MPFTILEENAQLEPKIAHLYFALVRVVFGNYSEILRLFLGLYSLVIREHFTPASYFTIVLLGTKA